METEYEVRVLEIDEEKIKEKLETLGATLKWEAIQRRYVYDLKPKIKGKWIRLRTNGHKTTLTIKDISSSKIDGTKELEIIVDNFDKTHSILKELGFFEKGYQENKRCQYILDGVEIDIDTWPLIPTYMEVEGTNEDEIYEIIERLGFTESDCVTKDVEQIYADYGYILDEIKILKLEEERK